MNQSILVLGILLCLISSTSLLSQSDNESIVNQTNKEIFFSSEIKPTQAIEIFNRRLTNAKSVEEEFECLLYIYKCYWRMGSTKIMSTKINELDSIAKRAPELLNKKLYRDFLFEKASLLDVNKSSIKARNILLSMESDIVGTKDSLELLEWHCKLAKINFSIGDRAIALDQLLRAEELNETLKDENWSAFILVLQADADYEAYRKNEALEKYITAAKTYEALDTRYNLLAIYRNIATVSSTLKKTELAIEYNEKHRLLQKELGSQIGYYSGELNKIWNYIQLEKYEAAVTQAHKTIALGNSQARPNIKAIYLMGIAHRGLDKYAEAATLIQKAFDLSKEDNHLGDCSFYSHALYQTYYWKHNYADALEWFTTHANYKDSLYNEEKAKSIAVLESKLESLDQKRKVEVLKAKVKMEKQKKFFLIVLLFLTLGLCMAMIYLQKQRNKNFKIQQEAKLVQAKLENERISQELDFKKKELTTQLLHMTHKTSVLQNIKDVIKGFKAEKNMSAIDRVLRIIDQSSTDEQEWSIFQESFNSIHGSFLEKLKTLSKALTSNEIRLASLMKMNISSKEIAKLLHVTEDGVKKARYRLRKKIGVESEINLYDFFIKI